MFQISNSCLLFSLELYEWKAMEELARKYGAKGAPLIAQAPMRLIANAPLAAAASKSGGLGFLGGGTDLSTLAEMLKDIDSLLAPVGSASNGTVPAPQFGIGIICWGANIQDFVKAMENAPRLPSAVWLFAPRNMQDLRSWAEAIKSSTKGFADVWVQIGSAAEAREACKYAKPTVLVCQGVDGGGHGLTDGCSFVSLVPEVSDLLDSLVVDGEIESRPYLVAAGGIADGRGAAAALALGADGITMGTRFLACPEANIAEGYRQEVIRASDGGQTTLRTKVYDTLRGTTGWPEKYGGRGVLNASYADWRNGISDVENKKLYDKSLKEDGDRGWGPSGRMTTYAGSAVGVVKQIMSAGEIVQEVHQSCRKRLNALQLQ